MEKRASVEWEADVREGYGTEREEMKGEEKIWRWNPYLKHTDDRDNKMQNAIDIYTT
jgi:hypothetical protein